MKSVLLLILDGLGMGKRDDGNAFYLAQTPEIGDLLENYSHTYLQASGEEVGLPKGQIGNSEVGHMNIGLGRVVYQDLTRINKDIKDGFFFENPVLLSMIEELKLKDRTLHLLGLVSFGGVHSHMHHLLALLEFCKNHDFFNVKIHGFLDGRDVNPMSGLEDIEFLLKKLEEIGVGKLVSLQGRYYAMDRDQRWERTERAYHAIAKGIGKMTNDFLFSIRESYDEEVTDEFLEPLVTKDSFVEEEDTLLFFNFRPDRARQLTKSFIEEDFDDFFKDPLKVQMISMTEYDKSFNIPLVYQPEDYKNGLGEIVSQLSYRQLRIAETEKYAHVTFFFNGGREEPYANEDRILVHSPKVPTYDLQPEMSIYEVTDHVLRALDDSYKLIILNFANPDMVGHTGNLEATVKAIESVDECVGKIKKKIKSSNQWTALITADHGNSEEMIDYKNETPMTAHTTNPVPFVIFPEKNISLKAGNLSNIAPTILELLKIEKPEEMLSESLILKEEY